MSKLSKHASSDIGKLPKSADIDDLQRQLQERTEQVEALLREHALLLADISLLEKECRSQELHRAIPEGAAVGQHVTAPRPSIPVATSPPGDNREIADVLERMRQEHVTLRQRADQAEADYHSVVTSTCWRITKPLRLARKIFG